MNARAFFYLVPCLFLLSGPRVATANQKPCTAAEENQVLDEADHLKDWDALHRSFMRFGHCDDGAIAEGYSETVGNLLAHDWKNIGVLAKVVASDKNFEVFVLRHIDETLSSDTLKTIANNAEKCRPAERQALCQRILQRAKSASSH